jgi:hypothetical protein
MSNAVLKGPCDAFEQRTNVTGTLGGQQEKELLEEFARLMGADVSALRLFDKTAGFAPREASQPSRLRVISIDKSTKKNGEDGDPLGCIDDAPSASSKTADSPELRGNGLRVPSSGSNIPYHEGLAPGEEAIQAPGHSRANLALGILVAVGVAGLISAWALKAAPGLPAAPTIDLAADDLSKVQPPVQEAVPTLPRDQAGKPSPVNLVSSAERSTELPQETKSPPTTPSGAAKPQPSGEPTSVAGPITTSIAPTARSIALVAESEALPAPATTVGQATGAASAPETGETALVHPDGAFISDDREFPTYAKPSPRLAGAPALPAPSDAVPQPVRPPVPVARPSFKALINGTAQPTVNKVDLPTKSSSKSINRAPNAKTVTINGNVSTALDLATAPGVAPAPVVASAPGGTTTSAESLLQLVPTLFDKGVSVVNGLVGDASRGS